MSTPIASYTVTSSTGPAVTVVAQSFEVLTNGSVVFSSATSQTVAAFAAGQWFQVQPVVTP